ncbi:MAG: hypothetical protein GY797_11900 [Deltaproteobacteria bacterium]|nr:hypothetical protein [Deltaproteobacteria bacterium]
MPFEKSLSISQLLLDIRNPRLPQVQNSQLDAIKTMGNTQADKIIALAEHLVNNGPNPASLPIVMQSDDDEEMYDVLDGNRRITALKFLETSSLMDGIFGGNKLKKMKELSTRFGENPIVELSCVVVADRDEADKWIQLIHRGQQQGAGLVEWDGQVAARYDARRDNKPNFALEVLDFVKENAPLSEETVERINNGKFPITNLERLINTPYVRKKLGVDKADDGKIIVSFPEEEVLKGLTRVVDDLGSRRVTVSKIKNQEQRIDYINSLGQDELPDPEKAFSTARPLGEPSADDNKSAKKKGQKTGQPRRRATLIPRNCKLNIDQPRIYKMFTEFKRLKVEEYPNAGAVMLRVFIELSLDHYLENIIGWTEQQRRGSTLAQKLKSVANYLEKNDIMSASQLAPIKKAADGQTLLAASVRTMHGYVHNRHFSPVASELQVVWDDFQPFMENLWPV